MDKFSSLIFFLLTSTFCLAQNTGSFLLIRNYGSDPDSYILESRLYEKYKSKISLDPKKIKEYTSCELYFINEQNREIEILKVGNQSDLDLGLLKDSLKKIDFRYGMGADYHFASQMADSLLKAGVYFYTVPELTASARFELNFSASFTGNTQQSAEDQYYTFRAKLLNDFPEIPEKNIHGFLDRKGEGHVLIYLEQASFDFKLLDKYQLSFTEKPRVRPRYYEIVVIEN